MITAHLELPFPELVDLLGNARESLFPAGFGLAAAEFLLVDLALDFDLGVLF